MIKEAHLYKKLNNQKTECQNCAHCCLILPEKRGICGVRENQNGKLYALNYNKAAAYHIDPIEKKPLFHFLPGSYSLSIAAVGCNLRCLNCQNYDLSQSPKPDKPILGEDLSAAAIIKIALENKLPSISYTYTEPAVFSEYALETMKLAKKAGLKNVWVSNGFWSKELFDLIFPYLDAVNIDLKSMENEFYQEICSGKLQPVLDTLKKIKSKNIWLELTTLIIPTLSDSEKNLREIAKFIKKELGDETPWHVSRFSGNISWKLHHLPDTLVEILQKAWNIGKETGLKYVYTGNVSDLPSEDTFCPECKTLIIDRTSYNISRYDRQGKCPKCNFKLDIIEEE